MSYHLFRNMSLYCVTPSQPQSHRKLKCFTLDKALIHCEKKMEGSGAVGDNALLVYKWAEKSRAKLQIHAMNSDRLKFQLCSGGQHTLSLFRVKPFSPPFFLARILAVGLFALHIFNTWNSFYRICLNRDTFFSKEWSVPLPGQKRTGSLTAQPLPGVTKGDEDTHPLPCFHFIGRIRKCMETTPKGDFLVCVFLESALLHRQQMAESVSQDTYLVHLTQIQGEPDEKEPQLCIHIGSGLMLTPQLISYTLGQIVWLVWLCFLTSQGVFGGVETTANLQEQILQWKKRSENESASEQVDGASCVSEGNSAQRIKGWASEKRDENNHFLLRCAAARPTHSYNRVHLILTLILGQATSIPIAQKGKWSKLSKAAELKRRRARNQSCVWFQNLSFSRPQSTLKNNISDRHNNLACAEPEEELALCPSVSLRRLGLCLSSQRPPCGRSSWHCSAWPLPPPTPTWSFKSPFCLW